MRFEQLAIHDDEQGSIRQTYKLLGGTFAEDNVTAVGVMQASEDEYISIENKAKLHFNYKNFPFEFELINYEHGQNFLQFVHFGEVSHFGLHTDKIDNHREYMVQRDFRIVQEVVTQEHSSPAVGENFYHYAIFQHNRHKDLRIKFIERLPYGPTQRDERTLAVLRRYKT